MRLWMWIVVALQAASGLLMYFMESNLPWAMGATTSISLTLVVLCLFTACQHDFEGVRERATFFAFFEFAFYLGALAFWSYLTGGAVARNGLIAAAAMLIVLIALIPFAYPTARHRHFEPLRDTRLP